MDITNITTAKNIKDIEDIRAMVNEACDARIKSLHLAERAAQISESNFGTLKETFENMSPSLFESVEGKKLIVRYTNCISQNRSLNNLHTLHENVRKSHSGGDVDFFINNISSVDWNLDKNELKEGKALLGKIVAESYLFLGDKAEQFVATDNEKLYNALSFIAENKKTPKNLSEYSVATKIIREHIENKEGNENIFEDKDLDKIAKNMIAKFNQKYDGTLTSEEYDIIKKISSGDASELFERYKTSCLNRLDEASKGYIEKGDENSVKRLETIKEQVSDKKYNAQTVSEDIFNLMEILHVFE